MFFALGMERVEARLQVAVDGDEIEEFLEQARPNEVLELFKYGIGRALELFRRRRQPPPRRSPRAITTDKYGADVTAMSGVQVPDDGVPRHRSPAS